MKFVFVFKLMKSNLLLLSVDQKKKKKDMNIIHPPCFTEVISLVDVFLIMCTNKMSYQYTETPQYGY